MSLSKKKVEIDNSKVLITCRDVTEKAKLELSLKENEYKLNMAIQGGQADSWDMNLITGDIRQYLIDYFIKSLLMFTTSRNN